jgi:crossover junction endodeoxyribonuclease RuvC
MAITGNGNSDKEQVWKMLQRILDLNHEITHYDASDALAVAVCHHFQNNSLFNNTSKKIKNWKEYVIKNPGRIL